jgi:predicted ATP-dependent protease
MPPLKPLPPTALIKKCDPSSLGFATTDELADLGESLGQARAEEALEFGVGITCKGYNLFALGPPGTGKHTMVRRHMEQAASKASIPSDWCYVNNFSESHRPRALELPPGRGHALREDMDRLIRDLREALPAQFEGDDYRTRREELEERFRETHESAFGSLQEEAKEQQIALVRTPMGMALAPVREGEVIDPEAFSKLPEEEQEATRQTIGELEKKLQVIMRAAPKWQREHLDRVRALHKEMIERVVGAMIDEVKKPYADLPKVVAYIDEVRSDIVTNGDGFIMPAGGPGIGGAGPADGPQVADGPEKPPGQPGPIDGFFRRYKINLIVDNANSDRAPVIYEDHPTQPNLVGRIEHMAQFGALVTDFTLIKAGALLRANGGYLILDAAKVLTQPYAWEELKRALRSYEVRIESIAESMGIVSTVSLQPERIPIDVKVVLIGDRQIYYLLSSLDPDFSELFKVAVDFDDIIDRNEENATHYARLIATMARRDKLRPLDAGAVARVIEHSARLVSDSEKLSAQMRHVVDLLHESHFWAGQDSAAVTSAPHVQKAIDAQIRRADRIRERSHEQITRGTMLIQTAGEAVGQLNGLSVMQIGGFAFGQPSRITARVRIGRGVVMDIEREVELGGPLHSKGVLILSGFLGAHYARNRPLSLAASLVFEQSYGGVDGDSASSTELYALLSALSGVPIGQNFAVTGSVDQNGQIQPIGGANEKIEGFFDICIARGLTGDQGVLIPATNVKNLMLRHDVVDAVEDGKFRIFAVETIDQGIEILTGVPAGDAAADGSWPDGSINALVQAQLDRFADQARSFARPDPGEAS